MRENRLQRSFLMGRPSKIGGFKPHPHPRLKDKVQLRDKLRGETDLTWNARFLVNETWTKPVSLGTKDYEEAKEIARDKFVLPEAGADISAKAKKVEEHTVDKYADIAVKELEKAAADAAKVAKGKEFNFLDLARRIKTVIKPAFGTLDIKKLDTDKLNDWAKDYEVEDVAATKARYGDQKRGPGRQRVMKAPA